MRSLVVLVLVLAVVVLATTTTLADLPTMCRPTDGVREFRCNSLMRMCNPKGFPMKWSGAGCTANGMRLKDAGCQCEAYCGYQCKSVCDTDDKCEWMGGECRNRETGEVGRPMDNCRVTAEPTSRPTSRPTLEPTSRPTFQPTLEPSLRPTLTPTFAPTRQPTLAPTSPTTTFPTPSPTQPWYQQTNAKLVGSLNAGMSFQGSAVSISGDGNTVVVGGPSDGNAASSIGAAWIFVRNTTTAVWSQQGPKLVGTFATGEEHIMQGSSVDISDAGDTVIVGGAGDGANRGSAWIFTRNTSNLQWTQQAKLTTAGSDQANRGSGVSLSANGRVAAVGGKSADSSVGATWMYRRQPNQSWTEEQKLVGSGYVVGSAGSGQGYAVALSGQGNTVVVGAPLDGNYRGAAWVFHWTGQSWEEQAPGKLLGSGASSTAQQGCSVGISAAGDTIIVGSLTDSAAWVFAWNNAGSKWEQQGSKLGSGSTTSSFGVGVSLSGDGNRAVIGALQETAGEGAAWVFVRSGGSMWSVETGSLRGTGDAGAAWQGSSVCMAANGQTFVSGGPGDASGVGAAWVFQRYA